MPRTSPARLAPLEPGKQRLAWFMSMSKPDDEVSATSAPPASISRLFFLCGKSRGVAPGTSSSPRRRPRPRASTRRRSRPSSSTRPSPAGAGRVRSRERPARQRYLPHQDVDEADDALCAFLRAAGTHVLKWRLSFWDDIPPKIRSSKQGHINVGAFGRLDVPLIASTILRKEFARRDLDPDYVLYTDTDVLFARDWPAWRELTTCRGCHRGWPNPKCCNHLLKSREPNVFLAGTEVFAIWGLNSGVMYMNVDQMLRDRRALLDWGNEKAWNFMMYDQGMLESFYRQRSRIDDLRRNNRTAADDFFKGWHAWDSFDDNKFNCRGFMKLPAVQPFVWHWHGFKPYDVRCWLDRLESGAWDLDLDVKSSLQAAGKHGSCRGLLNGRMGMHECSLATYLDLFAAHERLLVIADALGGAPPT